MRLIPAWTFSPPCAPDRDVRHRHRVTQQPDKKFRGDIEGPGRVREGRPNPAGASTATPNGVHRVYKAGDPELGLDVSKLNAYAAMQAAVASHPSSAPAPPPPVHAACAVMPTPLIHARRRP